MRENLKFQQFVFFIIVAFAIVIGTYLFSTYTDIPVYRSAGFYIPVSKAVMQGSTPIMDIDSRSSAASDMIAELRKGG